MNKFILATISAFNLSVSPALSPLAANAGQLTVGYVNIGDVDQWCKTESGARSFASDLNLGAAVAICNNPSGSEDASEFNCTGGFPEVY